MISTCGEKVKEGRSLMRWKLLALRVERAGHVRATTFWIRSKVGSAVFYEYGVVSTCCPIPRTVTMSPTAHLLAPSLSPSAILSVSAPSHLRPSSSSSSIIIKQYTLSSDHPLGVVKRIAVGKGKSRDDGGGSEEWMATFDSNNRLSLSKLPPAPGSEEYEDDSVEGRTLKVEACWKVQGGRKVDRCVGSEVLQR